MARSLFAVVWFPVAAALVAPLPAHGGQYRGPGPTPVVPPMSSRIVPAAIGAPTGPTTPGPTTGSRPAVADDTGWQVWWEFNKDPFLQLRAAVHEGPVTGSDDYFLGASRAVTARDAMAPTAADRRDLIAPVLARLLQTEHHRDIATACLVGLAKLGVDAPPDVDLPALFAQRLQRDDQEVRETAALAFGIDGRSGGLTTLARLVRDDAGGRRLLGNEAVPERTRAFAAYGLGLLARRSHDSAVKQAVHDVLAPLLAQAQSPSRDLRTAAVLGLGLLAPDCDVAAGKRLLWQTLGELWSYYDADLGRGEELLQAHVPIAIGRLLGRGDGPDHQKAVNRFCADAGSRSRRNVNVQQSAAQALGMIATADDAEVGKQLVRCYQEGSNQQARRFALIALARIGGAANRDELLRLYGPARKAIEKPWIAVALGICASTARQRGELDLGIGRLLLDELQSQQNDDLQAALAVGLGLSGCPDAGPKVQELLLANEREETLAGYLCVSLALLDDRTAVPTLSAVVQRSLHRPFLLLQAAVALGRLGDKTATPLLQEMMRDNDSAAALAALANALGYIGDRRSIEPLARMATDKELTKLARAFVAAALGGIGDKDEMPWNTCLAVDGNYAAAVETLTDGRAGVLDIL